MKNILLTIAYDGSRFHGWQRQPNEVTVQGFLEQTLTKLFRREIRLEGTSRTDAGVHALGQCATLRTDIGIPTERLARVANNALCGREEGAYAVSPVRILRAEEKPEGFHARFDATGKKYIYRISTAAQPDVFRRNYVYFPTQKLAGSGLDVGAMQYAAAQLVGTHDFQSFESAGGNPRQTTVRTITGARVITAEDALREDALPEGEAEHGCVAEHGFATQLGLRPDEILFEVRGDGFLYNMVRIITGTLVEIGQRKRAPEEMKDIIAAADRTTAGHTAPPYGLYLAEVYYGETALG